MRAKEQLPVQVLLELYLYEYQVEQGRHIHFQSRHGFFDESSEEVQEIQHGTLCAAHRVRELFQQRSYGGNNSFNKTSHIHATSRTVHQALDTRHSAQQAPVGNSSSRHRKAPRNRALAARLATAAADALVKDCGLPLMMSELLIREEVKRGAPDSDQRAVQQVSKRRRLRQRPLSGTAYQGSPVVTRESVFQK